MSPTIKIRRKRQ